MESSLSKRNGSNKLLFNFVTNSFAITELSGCTLSLILFTEIFTFRVSARLSPAVS